MSVIASTVKWGLQCMVLVILGLAGGSSFAVEVPPPSDAPSPHLSSVYKLTAAKRADLKSLVDAIEQNEVLKEAGCKQASGPRKDGRSVSYVCEKEGGAVFEAFQSVLMPGASLVTTSSLSLRLLRAATTCPLLTCVQSTLCSPTGRTDCCQRGAGGGPSTTCCPGWTCP
jgi:hypothetical protein